ncbi:hypothetical protein CFP65_4590 [Kitasatospora sp. MMS16-BH015]|uniref:DUF2079 domain-containing protein n=1 Tax=Kitasatospora sp. MMS16-BH015 TaxID=2018025 RepID=UPI000CA22D2D|nr:DUF2079 domain-containing protein [Kitasatospora sp. MMS16-BH015]AUG79327.1 hypothetical protein CFP65_4590 [Kitasatospora sp. MMS16-BH015]
MTTLTTAASVRVEPEIPERPAVGAPGRYLPWALTLLFFAVYTTLAFRRQDQALTTGYDLGIFEQAVRGYAEGHAPIVALKADGFNQLGDHFSPVLALIAPLYWLWPGAKALLLAQAALFALAVHPLTSWAQRRLGTGTALVVGLGYGASWGIASAAGFDFHEICFAVPLVAYATVALGEGRLGHAVAWAAPLVLVKEDLGLTVAAFGALVAWQGARRLGLATVVFGLAATALEMLVLLPAMNPGGEFAYWGQMDGSAAAGGGHSLLSLPLDLITPADKARTLILLLAPTAALALRSPLLALALPTLGWRLLSANPNYWTTYYHYSAVLMPILFAAFVDALHRRGLTTRARRGVLAVSLAVTALLVPTYPLGQLATGALWAHSDRAATVHRLLDRIPDGARVAASNRLVPQLTDRCTVILFDRPERWNTAEWLAVDEGKPMGWPLTPAQELDELALAKSDGYRVVVSEDGVTLLHR